MCANNFCFVVVSLRFFRKEKLNYKFLQYITNLYLPLPIDTKCTSSIDISGAISIAGYVVTQVAGLVGLFVPPLLIAYIIRSVSYSATTTQSSEIITIHRNSHTPTRYITLDRLRRVDYALDRKERESWTLENEIAYLSRANCIIITHPSSSAAPIGPRAFLFNTIIHQERSLWWGARLWAPKAKNVGREYIINVPA